jgi:hypothetical protein
LESDKTLISQQSATKGRGRERERESQQKEEMKTKINKHFKAQKLG